MGREQEVRRGKITFAAARALEVVPAPGPRDIALVADHVAAVGGVHGGEIAEVEGFI